ncbi:hypothetical protein H5P28_09590 [Ruficoccus amylovorans]|uniref:Uncharacterized protein n=1 Tax=Ruficoccus amylovorans TaxID=1804625 RepID=A0A842HE39_9BACT|nr:hypothetical protein [Ruficoccus amylovorans]MBC2594509.1 hypothetical protein [Ruficoccus amylovorans]
MPLPNARIMLRRTSAFLGGFAGYFVLTLILMLLSLLPHRSVSYGEFGELSLMLLFPCALGYALILWIGPRLPRWSVVPFSLGAYLVMLPAGFVLYLLASGQVASIPWLQVTITHHYATYWPIFATYLMLVFGTRVRAPRCPRDDD